MKYRIDLHVHIDGSVAPFTVYEISRKEHIEPECLMTPSQIAQSMIMSEDQPDPRFLKFEPPIRAMQSKHALERVTMELMEKMDSQNVIYAEPRFAPQLHTKKGLSQEEVVKACISGMRKALRKSKNFITAQLILCAMDYDDPSVNMEENLETVRVAAKYLGKGVCGVDLAGSEENLSKFEPVFALAEELHVPATVHTNRTSAEALAFRTRRIGHGYKTATSDELIETAIRQNTVFEICPQSSRSYNGIPIDSNHPLVRLYRSGVKTAVCTDNLTVLSTDLDHEYYLCEKMGLSDKDIMQMNINAAYGAFVDEKTRAKIISKLKEDENEM